MDNQQIDHVFRKIIRTDPSRHATLKYVPAASYERSIGPFGDDRARERFAVPWWFTVMNLDRENGPGTHWVAMFMSARERVYIDPLCGRYYRLPHVIAQFVQKYNVKHALSEPIQGAQLLDEYGRRYNDVYCGAYSIGLLLPYLIRAGQIKESYVRELETLFGITGDFEATKKILSADAIIDDFYRWLT